MSRMFLLMISNHVVKQKISLSLTSLFVTSVLTVSLSDDVNTSMVAFSLWSTLVSHHRPHHPVQSISCQLSPLVLQLLLSHIISYYRCWVWICQTPAQYLQDTFNGAKRSKCRKKRSEATWHLRMQKHHIPILIVHYRQLAVLQHKIPCQNKTKSTSKYCKVMLYLSSA